MIDWITSITNDGIINELPNNLGKYDIRFFNSPKKLEEAIKEKGSKEDTKLSRLIATYDWKYVEKKKPKDSEYWEVKIGDWHKPWNYQLKKQNKNIEKLSWAEQPQTINEVGSTFTIQGFDLNYAGLIIGPSVKYRNGHIVFDPSESKNKKAVQNRTLSDGTSKKFGEKLLKHELNVLMKRGVNGLYIYACDKELRAKLISCVQKKMIYPRGEKGWSNVAQDDNGYRYY